MLTKDLCRDILADLERGDPVAVAMIVEQSGSAPRHPGARMLVGPAGAVRHSLGGGSLEAGAIAMARETLADGRPRTRVFGLSGDPRSAGMICGGTTRVLVQRLEPGAGDWLALYRELAIRRTGSGRDWLITRLEPPVGQWLVGEDGSPLGVGALAAESAAALADGADPRRPLSRRLDGQTYLVEPLRPRMRLHLFGAGHIGRHLAALAALADFEIRVADDREAFLDAGRFPADTGLRHLASYDRALDGLELGPADALVLVTHGHRGDLAVLRQALATQAGYLGMIGSRRKWEGLKALLLEEGVAAPALARVHCPIGLPIGAETPVEIAVSILAELIRHRASSGCLGPGLDAS